MYDNSSQSRESPFLEPMEKFTDILPGFVESVLRLGYAGMSGQGSTVITGCEMQTEALIMNNSSSRVM